MALLTRTAFEPHQHTPFEIPQDTADPLVLELVEVTDKTPAGFSGEQFSLIFRGALDAFLPQGTYPVDHPEMGRLTLFLVPVDQRNDGYRYEAYFNLGSLDDA